jgi:tetratricopeptide (TPR) repeat protein
VNEERMLRQPAAARAWNLCASSALFALSLLLAPGQSRADCKIRSVELPVTMVSSRAITKLGINGTEVSLIVDSGAGRSTLTLAAAQQLQLELGMPVFDMRGINGEINGHATKVKSLKILGAEIPDVYFFVGGNDESTGGNMGLLGRNVLSMADTEYDLANGVIRLMFPNDECQGKGMAYWAGDKPVIEVPLLHGKYERAPAIEAVVQINGQKLRALFDTGATTLMSLSAAKRAAITDLKPAGVIYGAGKGQSQAWTATAASFELGTEKISNVGLRVSDYEDKSTDILVGIDFFLSHRIYISKSQRRMYLTYNGGPVFALSTKDDSQSVTTSTERPLDAAGYALRGAAAAVKRDFAVALADLDRACEMAPEVAEYFAQRGEVQLKLKQVALALKDFDRALQLNPDHAKARLLRAQLRARNHAREGALGDLKVLDGILKPQAHQRLEIAELYEGMGLLERALPQWAQWIPAHPHDIEMADVLNSRCWVRTRLNIELEQAMQDCEKAIDLQSKEGGYYNSRAWLQLRLGNQDKALADYDRALKLQPENALALYGRGVVRSKQGQGQTGQADIEAARKLIPAIDAMMAHYGLAADKP